MSRQTFLAGLLLALAAAAAEGPLPDLRIEPTAGGSIFYIRNASPQPLTAFLIELVDYPGSTYSLWQDYITTQSVPSNGEKRIPVTNMTVRAVPDSANARAGLKANGSSPCLPTKAAPPLARPPPLLA